MIWTKQGSSPLSRGIHLRRLLAAARSGIIPALAGNTRSAAGWGRSGADHPRSRGEYLAVEPVRAGLDGSSPLSRGIHDHARCPYPARRIIPALAGNTLSEAVLIRPIGDHPRSRGEYESLLRADAETRGSSPLSRGIRGAVKDVSGDAGIIPALAGNTAATSVPARPRRDHPRSRGEYGSRLVSRSLPPGSSPLSRGIPQPGRPEEPPTRIIPALAGNTQLLGVENPVITDHPRSRGEYRGTECGEAALQGSSPLSRGIRRRPLQGRRLRRIIPALAGNTR